MDFDRPLVNPSASLKIVLFGATFALGQKFAKTALEAGHSLKVLKPKGMSTGLSWSHPSLELMEADFSDPETYSACLEGQDTIVFLGSQENGFFQAKPEQAARQLLTEREKLLRTAVRQGIRKVILLGDAGLFAPVDPEEMALESNPISGQGYGRAYQLIWDALRALCQETGLGTRVHPGKIYGPLTWFQRDLVEPLKFKGRAEMVGKGCNWVSPVHVHDAAQGLMLAVEKGQADADYILAAEPLRWNDFIALTMSYMGCRQVPRIQPFWLSRFRRGIMEAEAATLSCRAKTLHAGHDLGWSPVYANAKEGIPHVLKDLGALAWN